MRVEVVGGHSALPPPHPAASYTVTLNLTVTLFSKTKHQTLFILDQF